MKGYQRKNQQKDFFEILPQAIGSLKKNILEPFLGDANSERFNNGRAPLRAELFTEAQLEQHASALAKRHVLISEHPSELLLSRLAENENLLLGVHALLTETVKQNIRIVPAGEWLLDNFYLIEEQIYTGKKHLPKGYSKGLPQLLKGESAGLPRVYDIAVEIISHSDGHVDMHTLNSFIRGYQTTTYLKLGELWAVPIMLRLALIENLRRLSVQISQDIKLKMLANQWADKIIESAEKDPKNLVLIIADMARSEPPMESAFVAELSRRLQEKGNTLTLPLNWIEQQLSSNGYTTANLVQEENQKQAADQVSISNSISGLRFLSNTDWREFVENSSAVEAVLRQDINGIYAGMDFFTRDYYRHSVEKIAKRSELSEKEVAELVIRLCRKNADDQKNDRTTHVGYYLTGKGMLLLKKEVGVKFSRSEYSRDLTNKWPLLVYLGSILLLSGLFCWGLVARASVEGHEKRILIAVIIIALLAVSRLAVSMVNWFSSVLARPALLPRMDYSKGIPDNFKSMVVVPTLLTNLQVIDDLLEGMEVRFLANRDKNVRFALLTDFKDADKEVMPDDEAILDAIKNKITALNRKYDRQSNDTFLLFHRPRKWNVQDKIWMGYERKRGKLGDLNALLRGAGHDNFSLIVGDESAYSDIKFIITLDTDTQLPRDTAWKMIGTLAHPLNQAVYNERKKRVTDGYTILQPRVSNSMPGSESSLYAKIHGNEPGTDPYTRATSDVYQDLFGEGSFIGKGIYDIDAFEKALKDRLPENRILSHDLLEGCYSRSGLVSDVQLYEEYPEKYSTDMQRRHRWIRGDWQIASWVLPWAPGFDKRLKKNPVSLFSKWKIFDNIRRSLVPLSLLLLFIFGWTISPEPWFWTLAVTIIIVLPSVINFFWDVCRKPADVIFIQHVIFSLRSAADQFIQHLIDLTCLPYEVFSNIDAICRTLWRMWISKKHLLQWNPYSSTMSKGNSIAASYRTMWVAPFFAIATAVYLSIYYPLSLIVAAPILILWGLAPFLTWWASMPGKAKLANVSADQKIYLRKLSRKIWHFFETFVGDHDNWLPPDNYQEEPVERIAHRTSPTNMGMYLLANLTAYDFGYILPGQLIERTANTLGTMQRLERSRGHLYNWYDTVTLQPLHPRYISTVDSGNMAGHLITLKQGLLSLPDKKIISHDIYRGLGDAVGILLDKTGEHGDLEKFLERLNTLADQEPNGLEQTKLIIDELDQTFDDIGISLDAVPDSETDVWLQKTAAQLQQIKSELTAMVPWILLPPAPTKFEHLLPSLPLVPSVLQLSRIEQILLQQINTCYNTDNTTEENDWLNNFRSHITTSAQRAKELLLSIEQLVNVCTDLSTMDYDFLYDKSQHLLSIGYNESEQRRDNSFYDLLASEARLTTFVAIAQGKLPQDSWFALGRQLTNLGTKPILLSWSGSMFEYLMPALVMPNYDNTLLDETNKTVIQKQIDYAKKRGIPWGISESGYNLVDASLNYQYKAFGVPGLGFKRGLGEDVVISPYSTIMSLMVNPDAANHNLEVMSNLGFEGRYGFYEAIDYTPTRLVRRQTHAVVRSFMAHHQGMSFLSLAYLLLDKPMQQRFQSDVQIKATLLLLQEKVPRITTFYSPSVHASDISIVTGSDSSMRVINTPHTAVPEVQLLSNGRYHVMVTNSGGGYSRWKNIAVTRWREDATCDNWGSFCYIRDVDNDTFWSSAYQPTLQQGENYEAVFSQGRAEFRRRDMSLETHTEIVVSPEDDIELRRVHITNKSRKRRVLEITSYAEVVLAPASADEAHPAFSNLFVQTEINKQRHAIICTRRPRSSSEHAPSMFHLMKTHGAGVKDISYETNRSAFIGRGNNIQSPRVMSVNEGLSNQEGSVLDPIISIQYRIVIEPNESAIIDMITGIADTKEICNNLIEKYQDRNLTNRVLELAWTHSQVILRQINAKEADAQLYSRMAGSVIFANDALRTDASVIIKNHRGQSGLWSYSISGDLPIVLLQIEDASNIDLVKQLVQAHAYWRLKGLAVDLVIWNEDHGGYRQVLHNDILNLISPAATAPQDQPGGIFIRSSDQVSNEDRILFQTVAHIIISDRLGTLEEQMNRRNKLKSAIPYFSPTKFHTSQLTSVPERTGLQFYNGYGGFSADGKEYIITTTPEKSTPAPWINVLANAGFGSVISESGQSYTWLENAHEYRLTPWNNDPVGDLKGEAFYIRDEESGRFWSPAPLPCRGKSPYITRHGFGYSIFEHSEDGIYSSMTVFTEVDAPVKFIVIKLRNESGRSRKVSVTGYAEWILGDIRSKSVMHVITEMDMRSGAITARNAYNTEFEGRVAFFDVDDSTRTYTCDRNEFIGRNGTMSNPNAMNRARLSGKVGAAMDPCAALQTGFDLAEDEEKDIVFRIGAGKSMDEVLSLIRRFEGNQAATEALQKVHHHWHETLNHVQIDTPDAAVNILANGWLTYQTLTCRIHARSGFYQSGGAFGFRDQLQDTLSLLHADPAIVRQQILLCASRQFREGDVQHWWHPPLGRGVRTTCSDDYLWLPFVTARYVTSTGDTTILDELQHFLEGRPLNTGEESYYDLPLRSDDSVTLYEHCVKSIENGLRFGIHGLPLMGSGDWNDGMDKVGEHGKGESVWLAFFLYEILNAFKPIARLKHDDAFEKKCDEQAIQLKMKIEMNAWDGEWYRRAYFDDGTPLGSHGNDECKIDSIAQSWSVLSKAAPADRAATAMKSAGEHLIRKDIKIIQLFNPPFDKSTLNPGYIKGYVPGVRENGGQYTHAAIWLVMAYAAIKDKKQTWDLLRMINPINHGGDAASIATYKVEPYVIAADVYAEALHKGRGGWTWYTGSAGWMYQLMIDWFIGLKKEGDVLSFDPCIPEDWPGVTINYVYKETTYKIHYKQAGAVGSAMTLMIDNNRLENNKLKLENDGRVHEVEVMMPAQ